MQTGSATRRAEQRSSRGAKSLPLLTSLCSSALCVPPLSVRIPNPKARSLRAGESSWVREGCAALAEERHHRGHPRADATAGQTHSTVRQRGQSTAVPSRQHTTRGTQDDEVRGEAHPLLSSVAAVAVRQSSVKSEPEAAAAPASSPRESQQTLNASKKRALAAAAGDANSDDDERLPAAAAASSSVAKKARAEPSSDNGSSGGKPGVVQLGGQKRVEVSKFKVRLQRLLYTHSTRWLHQAPLRCTRTAPRLASCACWLIQ